MKYPAQRARGCPSTFLECFIASTMLAEFSLFRSASLCIWVNLVRMLSMGRVAAAEIPVARRSAKGSTKPYYPNLVKRPSLK